MLPPSAGGIENSLRTRAESLASRYWRLQKVFSKKYWRVCEARDLCFPPLACGIQQNTRTPVPKVIHAVLLTINPSSRARASGEASTNNSTPAGDARREHREQITGLGATCAVNICKYLDEGSYFCTHTHTRTINSVYCERENPIVQWQQNFFPKQPGNGNTIAHSVGLRGTSLPLQCVGRCSRQQGCQAITVHILHTVVQQISAQRVKKGKLK